METMYFMDCIETARALTEKERLLAAEYANKQPAPGAPVNDFFAVIAPEFYKAPGDIVSRAFHADAGRARAAINGGIGCVCLAPNGNGKRTFTAGKEAELDTLNISSEYIDRLKKQAKTPLMLYLVETMKEYAEHLGGLACEDALVAASKKKDLPTPAFSPVWPLLAATIRVFNALAQGNPVNVPDVIYSTCQCVPNLETSASALTEAAYTAAVKPGCLNGDDDINIWANAIKTIAARITGLLACCDIPGITTDGYTVSVEFEKDQDGADLSIDEITYLSKKAQGMKENTETAALKDKCTRLYSDNADKYTLARAITEYFTAVRNNL